jgi:hypothetical protein
VREGRSEDMGDRTDQHNLVGIYCSGESYFYDNLKAFN